jgi:tRNA nucleotidyltransferase (CCA-adding enzyme)
LEEWNLPDYLNRPGIISIPSGPLSIINTLNKADFEAFIVGGCVRDSILEKAPKDWDITTNAKPDETKNLFPRTLETGIKHGTVTILLNGESFEVTTYRIDGVYEDNRRPESVYFTSNLEEDLKRRDFTVNSIAYHPSIGFVDPFNGILDIENEIIRCVGDSNQRFEEDALRMLRAVRFSAQLNFKIDHATVEGIRKNNHLIKNISQERVRDELTKLLLSDFPEYLAILYQAGILSFVLPEFESCFTTEQNNPYHIFNVALHTLKSVKEIRKDPVLRWAMLLHDLGKPQTKTTDKSNKDHFYGHQEKSYYIAQKVLTRLKFDRKSMDRISRLVKLHDRQIELTCKAVKKAVIAVGDDLFTDLLEVKEADYRAQNPVYLNKRLEKLRLIRIMYDNIKSENQCFSLKNLAVSGNDLIKEGFKEGKEIGEMLGRLLDAVIDDPELNDKEKLLELAHNEYIAH